MGPSKGAGTSLGSRSAHRKDPIHFWQHHPQLSDPYVVIILAVTVMDTLFLINFVIQVYTLQFKSRVQGGFMRNLSLSIVPPPAERLGTVAVATK
jgi:hypothetical protein